MASDSESFYEESPAATPQPLDADMPSLQHLARATPSASMMAGPASSSITLAAELPRTSKGRSSTMSSSITPPPSTQAASMRGKACDDTLSAMLSSPPPTISNGITRAGVSVSGAYRPSNSKINSASPEQLREIIYGLLANEAKQEAMLAESRMTIAHLNLQMNMLSAEKESEIQRMEVEHSMTKREVAMLSMARSNTNTPGSSLLTNYIKLDEKHQALVEICDGLHRRLDRAKKVIENKTDEIFDLHKEIGMYKNRIREKHDTYQHLRSPGGPFHSSNLKTPIFSNPDTPQQYRDTPKRTPVTGRSVGREGPFDALLLADRVLSQENNSAPSTPIISRRPEPRTPIRHQRAAQSLSSLQTTPGSARPMAGNVSLLPSAQFHNPPQTHVRRRKSRDSTISAPDAEEIARAALAGFGDSSEDDVNESQASQEAAALLRADPKESFEVLSSRTGTPIPAEKGIQVKLHTTVTKTAMMEKRKYVDDGGDNITKKPRVDVGLGIFSPRG